MSIVIRKKETGEIFDVPQAFALEINNTSPLFNELGSKSVTMNLPKTPNNIRLLGFAHRLDIADRPPLKIAVLVVSGSYNREGVLYLSSAYNTENTFGVTIAFNEGIMYESMSNILLTELSNLPVIKSTVDDLIQRMNTLFTKDSLDDDLSVFYVRYKKQTYRKDDDADTDLFWYEYANHVKMQSENTAQLDNREHTYAIENNKLVEISVPRGYGITPFVRVWYILELIFDHFGYKVGANPFKADFQLRRLCVLNNTIDAIVSGTLYYKQLLPPVSINDFLNALYLRFGLKVTFDGNTNTVNLVLLRDIFQANSRPQIPLSSLIDIDYTAPKQLKLSVAKSLDESDTETDVFEDFLIKYNNTIGTIDSTLNQIHLGGVYFDPRAGQYYQISTVGQEKKRLSSIHFDWNKKDEGVDLEEISSIDEALTMHHEEASDYVFLYYGKSHQLLNSILSIDGIDQKSESENVLAFAYDMGQAVIDLGNGSTQSLGYKYGSIFPYAWQSANVLQKDPEGNEFNYALTLIGEYGAFNQFFKAYDAFLRHSNHEVTFESYQSVFDLSVIKFDQQVIVHNQPLLLDKVDHQLDGHANQLSTIKARTMRLYDPYDLEKEQALPQPEPIKYKWVLYSNRDQQIKERWSEINKSLPETVPENYVNMSLSQGTIRDDPNPPGSGSYWFLPPNEEQYKNGDETGSRTHTCTVEYTYTYMINTSASVGQPNWQILEQLYKEEIVYKSWFKAELL